MATSPSPSQLRQILHPVLVRDLIQSWLKEDTSSYDLAAVALSKFGVSATSRCEIIVKEKAILAGQPFADAVFTELSCTAEWNVQDGTELEAYSKVCTISGTSSNLLLAERVVLNCLARASGVATVSRRVRDMVRQAGWAGEVVGTRKTTPGFRMVEKYATLVGGIGTHRYDLSNMIMLKDNHLKFTGSIKEAVKTARAVGGFNTKIEVECGNLGEALEACSSGCDVVMLDNFEPEEVLHAAASLKGFFPSILIEVSGGINEDNIIKYTLKHVDVISSSMFVQGYKTIDFSMKVVIE